MNNAKKEKLYNEKGIVYQKQYKKIWYSMTKYEKYPEMAAEGVGRALIYLLRLSLLFALIFAVAVGIKSNIVAKDTTNYLQNNISDLKYENGKLDINIENNNKQFSTTFGNIIFDTKDTENENYTGNVVAFKNDHLVVSYNGVKNEMKYTDIFDYNGIKSFDKNDIVNYIEKLVKTPQIYIIYFVALFILIFISTILNVVLLSIFGLLTGLIAGLNIKYRAVFNMSIYAVTLPMVLQLIYYIINCFTGFEVKYFDFMYSAISYICLAAAIFMIKSDLIKQQIEFVKTIKKKQKEDEINSKQEEKKDDKENENTNDKNDNEEKEKGLNNTENQESNAENA